MPISRLSNLHIGPVPSAWAGTSRLTFRTPINSRVGLVQGWVSPYEVCPGFNCLFAFMRWDGIGPHSQPIGSNPTIEQ